MSDVAEKKERDHLEHMPQSVRVGFIDVALIRIDEDVANIPGIAGAANGFRQKIYMREGMTPQQTANTFFHEVNHIIHYVYGLMREDHADEETCTTLTANGWCAFAMDNPKAMIWWMALLVPGMMPGVGEPQPEGCAGGCEGCQEGTPA